MSHVSEMRLTERLTQYWNLMRKELPFPEYAQFNSHAVADVWPQCLVLGVLPAAEHMQPSLKFTAIGDMVAGLFNRDMLGQTLVPSQKLFQAASLVRRAHELVASPAPLNDAGQFMNEKNKVVKYRSLLLPFGRSEKVTHIVAGISWREF